MKIFANSGVKLLAGAIALAVASIAHATPVTVHYALYNLDGAAMTSGGTAISGDVGAVGNNSWINNPTLVSNEHLARYLVKFWIGPDVSVTQVTWTFDWALAYGGSWTANRLGVLLSAGVRTDIALGTSQAGLLAGTGATIASDSVGASMSQRIMYTSGQGYNFGSAASVSNQKTGQVVWNGGSTTEVWALVDGVSNALGSSNANFAPFSYGNVVASADAVVAQPLFPGSVIAGDGGGGAVPEPASLALLLGAGLVGMARRRRDRLKP